MSADRTRLVSWHNPAERLLRHTKDAVSPRCILPAEAGLMSLESAKTSTEERRLHRHRERKRAWYLRPLTCRGDRIPDFFARH